MIRELINPYLLNEVKNKWPQLNDNTKISYVKNDNISIADLWVKEANTEIFSNYKQDVKEAVQENLNCVINDRHYLNKLMDSQFDQAHERVFYLELFYFNNGFNTERLLCYYHAENDTLFINPDIN